MSSRSERPVSGREALPCEERRPGGPGGERRTDRYAQRRDKQRRDRYADDRAAVQEGTRIEERLGAHRYDHQPGHRSTRRPEPAQESRSRAIAVTVLLVLIVALVVAGVLGTPGAGAGDVNGPVPFSILPLTPAYATDTTETTSRTSTTTTTLLSPMASPSTASGD